MLYFFWYFACLFAPLIPHSFFLSVVDAWFAIPSPHFSPKICGFLFIFLLFSTFSLSPLQSQLFLSKKNTGVFLFFSHGIGRQCWSLSSIALSSHPFAPFPSNKWASYGGRVFLANPKNMKSRSVMAVFRLESSMNQPIFLETVV